jgi:3-methylcrotonyl-CoA carboxylase alpha subunit
MLGDVVTNLAFLRALCKHPAFCAGETTTDFIDQHLENWQETVPSPSDPVLIAAALAETLERNVQSTPQVSLASSDSYNPWQQMKGFRLGVTDG